MKGICSFTTFLFVALFSSRFPAEILYSITSVDPKKVKNRGCRDPKLIKGIPNHIINVRGADIFI